MLERYRGYVTFDTAQLQVSFRVQCVGTDSHRYKAKTDEDKKESLTFN